MADLTAASFGDLIAKRIELEHIAISAHWLERLRGLMTVDANAVFPSDQLLDHIPALIRDIADYIRTPEDAVVANTSLTVKAQELGLLRHSQRASVHQLVAEYRLLGGILLHFVQEELQKLGGPPAAAEVVEVLRRVTDAVWILMQTTVDTFVSEYTATIASHTSRIDSFNRMVSHELRQPIGTLVYALPLLKVESTRTNRDRHDHLVTVMDRNVTKVTELIEQLETLSRLRDVADDGPDVQHTDVAMSAWEVARQLREMADAREVEIQIADELPELVIDRARLELILTNLISNGIKYSDPRKSPRFVRVEAVPVQDAAMAGIAVRDNGLGIPPESLDAIFSRFVRAHAERDQELGVRGSGLGLAIAAECAEAVGGRLAVESVEGVGSTFFVTLPRPTSSNASTTR